MYIKAMDGEHVSATFFGPYNKIHEPYAKVAVGDFHELAVDKDVYNACCVIACSLLHELTHYFQWLNDTELTEEQEERQARYYAVKILNCYLDDVYDD